MVNQTAKPNPQGMGDAVRTVMRKEHVSQRQMAARLGLSQPAVHRRLTGAVEFSVSEVFAVSAALGVSVEDLIAAAK